MACRTVMPLLLSGTFCILLNGAGWVVEVGVNHLVMYQHSCCWFSPSQTEIIQQQLPHCSSHGCPHVQGQLSCGANQSNILLRTSSLLAKTESRGYTEFILMKLHICISRDYLIESWICSLLVCHIHLLPSPAVLLNYFANLLVLWNPLCPLGKELPRSIYRKQLEAGSAPAYLLDVQEMGLQRTVVILWNGDHSVMSFSPQRESS